MKNIIEHINKAKKQSLKSNIKANAIVIDKDIAVMNSMYYPTEYGINYIPPMIMGMKVEYEENLTEEYGFNFVLIERLVPENKSLKDYSTEELLDELKRRINDND